MATAYAPTEHASEPRERAPLRLVVTPPLPPARYGERQGPNLVTLAIIAAMHVLLIVTLIKLDVIAVSRPKPSELKVIDIAEDVPPRPLEAAPPPPQTPQPPSPAVTPVVAPPRLVETPVASAPIVSAPAPAPVVAEATAPAAAAPAPPTSAPVAAIVPPNGSAKSLNNPSPRYPVESRRKREQGTVRLRVVITVDGRVREIAVARSSGFERLDEAALDVVRRWRFLPGTQAGAPVEAVGYLNIPFQLT